MQARTRYIALAIVAFALAACSESPIAPTQATQGPQAGLVVTADDPNGVSSSFDTDANVVTVNYSGFPNLPYKINFACGTAPFNKNGRPTGAGTCPAGLPSAAPLQIGGGPVYVAFDDNDLALGDLYACVRLQNDLNIEEHNNHPWHCAPVTTTTTEECPEGYQGTPPDCVPITNDVVQLVTVPSGTKVYGEGDWTIVAHTNAPLDLQVSVTGDGCEQVGDAVNADAEGGGVDATITLHILQVGSCDIEAGNTGGIVGEDNWQGASATGTWTITPAPLTCKADDKSKNYDGQVYSGGYTMQCGVFVYDEDVSDLGGSPTFGGTSQTAVNVGGYPITPGGYTSTNYNISFVDGTLTINKVPLVITAANKTMILGSATIPPCTIASYVSFVSGEGVGNLGGALSCPTPIGPFTLGTYPGVYVPSGYTSNNYTISYVPGSLTVTGKCWLSQGYWKTHTTVWPVSSGKTPTSTFFTSGTTWIKVWGTSANGNAYYILAYQYMAAVLNLANGSSDPDGAVAALVAQAATKFGSVTSPTKISAADKPNWISLATALQTWNAQFPTHCGSDTGAP